MPTAPSAETTSVLVFLQPLATPALTLGHRKGSQTNRKRGKDGRRVVCLILRTFRSCLGD
jgi:hypothetical protein